MDSHTQGLLLRARLLADGFTSAEVQRGRRAGRLVNVRRGAYVRPEDGRLRAAESRHRLLVSATVPRIAAVSVVSHVSAAVAHGLPVWGVPLDRVHVSRDEPTGGRITGVIHRHTAPLSPAEITEVGGMPVTCVARTVIDLARTVPFEQAVVVADAALRFRMVDPVTLDAALRRATGWPGSPRARRVVAFADGRSGSVGESRSRVALRACGLPVPTPQWKVTAGGRVLAEVDFGWPELRTVGEFDGRVKYGRGLRSGQSAGDAVFAEKVREDAIRSTGLGVVRWIWADLDAFGPVATRLQNTYASP